VEPTSTDSGRDHPPPRDVLYNRGAQKYITLWHIDFTLLIVWRSLTAHHLQYDIWLRESERKREMNLRPPTPPKQLAKPPKLRKSRGFGSENERLDNRTGRGSFYQCYALERSLTDHLTRKQSSVVSCDPPKNYDLPPMSVFRAVIVLRS
jgi:hypothetical protein